MDLLPAYIELFKKRHYNITKLMVDIDKKLKDDIIKYHSNSIILYCDSAVGMMHYKYCRDNNITINYRNINQCYDNLAFDKLNDIHSMLPYHDELRTLNISNECLFQIHFSKKPHKINKFLYPLPKVPNFNISDFANHIINIADCKRTYVSGANRLTHETKITHTFTYQANHHYNIKKFFKYYVKNHKLYQKLIITSMSANTNMNIDKYLMILILIKNTGMEIDSFTTWKIFNTNYYGGYYNPAKNMKLICWHFNIGQGKAQLGNKLKQIFL